jgi:hypothetical protein
MPVLPRSKLPAPKLAVRIAARTVTEIAKTAMGIARTGTTVIGLAKVMAKVKVVSLASVAAEDAYNWASESRK